MWSHVRDAFVDIARSFYDVSLYKIAITNGRGFGGRHALAVGFISTLFLLVVAGVYIETFKRTTLPDIIDHVPTITITDGVVSVPDNVTMPINLKIDDKLFVVDTTRPAAKFGDEPGFFMGIGKDFIITKVPEGLEKRSIKKDANVVINADMVRSLFASYLLLFLFALPMISVIQSGLFLIQGVLMAVVTYVVTSFMREEYDFETRLRLSVLAITPPTIIINVLTITLLHQTSAWFLFLVGALYFYVMIRLMRAEKTTG